ncbi:hypothetical protein WDU94_015520 [Cyamophila willieti]
MYLHIFEDFYLAIGREISGSTISIGGEEKKKKITTELCQAETVARGVREYKLQSTQDATKWNECLSADLFALFHMVLFSTEVRDKLDFPHPSSHEKLFRDICLHGHFILAIKRIALVEAPIMRGEGTFNRPDWDDITPERLNETFKLVWEEMNKYRKGMYLESSPGMLMGMHNALSTTLALAAVGYGTDNFNSSVATLRSSDDSTTAYYGRTINDVKDAILYEILGLKLLGINMSLDKTFYFRYNYSDYCKSDTNNPENRFFRTIEESNAINHKTSSRKWFPQILFKQFEGIASASTAGEAEERACDALLGHMLKYAVEKRDANRKESM